MVKHILPQNILKTLYETLIQPHLEYGITFQGGTHVSHVNKLKIIQKKVIRNITNSKYNEHTDPLFSQLKILKLNQLHKLKTAKLMYKASKSELPPQITDLFKPNTQIHNHNTRQHGNPHIRHRRTQIASKQINHKGPEIWQAIPNHIKTLSTLNRFTKAYKSHLITNNI